MDTQSSYGELILNTNGAKLKLLDLIDIEFLQEFQDFFANTMGVASLTVDENGPITKPSNFTDFCLKYTRGSEEGQKRCNACDIKWGEISAKNNKPVIYTCHSGLTDFAVPIIIEGKHIASIYGGQIITKEPDLKYFRKLAKELGINEEEYIEAVKKIRIIPQEQVDAAANFLYFIANSISQIGLKNFELIKKNERENLIRQIIETVRSSLDINEVKSKVTEIIGKAFNADRCYFRSFDEINDKFLPPDSEYVNPSVTKSSSSIEADQEALRYFSEEVKKQKKGFYPVVVNEEIAKDTILEGYLKSLDIKADYAIPIISRQEETSWLVLHYTKEDPKFDESYKKLLETIAYQIDIAFEQIRLYNEAKKSAEQERIIRVIINKIRSSLNTEEIKYEIVNQIGKQFNADRVTLGYYDPINKTHKVTKHAEYKSSNAIKSFIDIDFIQVPGFVEYIREVLLRNKELIFNNLELYLAENNLIGTQAEDFYRNFDYKSSAAINVSYNDIFLGNLVVTFTGPHNFTNDEIKLLKSVAEQAGVAFYQGELYRKTRVQAKVETLLRNITQNIRSSLDLDETFYFICKETANAFNVQRTAITYFKNPNNYEDFVIRKEYKASPEINGYPYNENAHKTAAYWARDLVLKNEIIAFNSIKDADLPDYFKEAYAQMGVKSVIGVSIKKEGSILGTLVLSEYNSYRNWTEEEKELLKTISDQVFIAITQAELFNELKQTTINQNAILNNMPFMAWLKDSESKLLAVNETFANTCNEKIENIIGKTDYDLFPKEYAETYTKEDKLAMESKETIASIDAIVGSNGEEKWHETFKSPVIDSKGNAVGTAGISQDITERRHLEISIIEGTNKLNAIFNNIPHWAWLKDREKRFILVNKKFAQDLNLTTEDFIGKTDFDLFPEKLATAYNDIDQKVMDTGELITVEEETLINSEQRFFETFKQPFYNSQGEIMGTVGIANDITERKANELELISRQEKIIKANEKEVLLRRIVETMRSSLDVNLVKNTIVNVIAETFKANRCFILNYNESEDNFYVTKECEYLSSNDEKSLIGINTNMFSEHKVMDYLKKGNDANYSNVDEYIQKQNLQGSPEENFLKEYEIKSSYKIPIFHANTFLGFIIIEYTKSYKALDESDLAFLNIIATQAGIAIHQAELFEITQRQAATEKFNRRILEILRNTLDKATIKHLFVVNIGKYFHADRVFFADYDPVENIFLPIDEQSEYLSSTQEKSFVGLDWSESSFAEYIQPMLEKRELKIDCWDDFIKTNYKSQEFISRFEDYKVKSSYNLPVIHEGRIMGYFCVEFTQNVCVKLSDEDINRIRGMCSQAGIALYHAELFIKAEEASNLKEMVISKITNGATSMLNNIVEISEEMSRTELQCEQHIEHMNHINEIVKKLLDFTENINNS